MRSHITVKSLTPSLARAVKGMDKFDKKAYFGGGGSDSDSTADSSSDDSDDTTSQSESESCSDIDELAELVYLMQQQDSKSTGGGSKASRVSRLKTKAEKIEEKAKREAAKPMQGSGRSLMASVKNLELVKKYQASTGQDLDSVIDVVQSGPNGRRRDLRPANASPEMIKKIQSVQKSKADVENLQTALGRKTEFRTRDRLHDLFDDIEILADLIMIEALRSPGYQARLLMTRSKILGRLWILREEADIEDDLTNEEFAEDMKVLAVIRRKLGNLSTNVQRMTQGADESSSDTDGEDNQDKKDLTNLKNARQNLRYALGAGSIPAA